MGILCPVKAMIVSKLESMKALEASTLGIRQKPLDRFWQTSGVYSPNFGGGVCRSWRGRSCGFRSWLRAKADDSESTPIARLDAGGVSMSVKLCLDASRVQLMALETELAAARNRIRELEDQIETDLLVNLLNRSGFERALKRGLDYVNRYKASAAVILIDLDNFKSINDRYGRVAGDTVLKAVSNTITRHVRSSDIVGRFGGDEFAVLLWQMCNADAQAKALALEEMIADLKIFYSAEILSITASAGVAMLRPLDSPSNVIGLADRSLYHRKLRRSHEPEVNSTIVRVGKMPDQSKGYDPTIDRPFWEVQRWKRMRTSSASS